MNRAGTTLVMTETSAREGRQIAWFVVKALLGFCILWFFFYGIFRAFPYLSEGAAVIYRSKLKQEMHGAIYPADFNGRRVLIFGDSKVLAGFVPDLFDSLATQGGIDVRSYNSGYPAHPGFVPELRQMTENKSSVPDVLLLTNPWASAAQGVDAFHPLPHDHELADRLFPFRYLFRDSLSFLFTSRAHGGVLNFYREAQRNDANMIRDRGYYFIAEQSHYPNDSLPDSFHLSSDQPQQVALREADATSPELMELNEIVREHHIHCYFVPYYMRTGEAAPAPAIDQAFAELLERSTSCKMLGPDYYLYPPHLFSDMTHLNREGAKIYTADIYGLVAKQLGER